MGVNHITRRRWKQLAVRGRDAETRARPSRLGRRTCLRRSPEDAGLGGQDGVASPPSTYSNSKS